MGNPNLSLEYPWHYMGHTVSLGDEMRRKISRCIWWSLHPLKNHRILSHIIGICLSLPPTQGFAQADHGFLRSQTLSFFTKALTICYAWIVLFSIPQLLMHVRSRSALINHVTLGESQSLGWIITVTPFNSVLPRSPASHLSPCSSKLFLHWFLVGNSAHCA